MAETRKSEICADLAELPAENDECSLAIRRGVEANDISHAHRQVDPIEVKDQNGTVHAYVYDGLGRQTADKITTVGTGVDDSVRRIARMYEVRGMTEHITSYDAASDGNVVNDVLREYDTLGRMTKEYQEHSGAKDDNTLYVETAYENMATALRPTLIRYPNGRQLFFDYSGTDDNRLNRLTKILDSDDVTLLAEYTYLGAGTMVVENYVQPQVKLDYFGGTSGTYAGFDNLGRVVQQLWYDYGTSANRDKFTYGYNRASNRIYREHSLATLKDEFYSYDGVNQLTASQRGTLTQNKDGISGTPSREEDFTLDPLGNWTAYVHKTDGTTDLGQTRTHNTANELTAASSWATPVHDRAGNMTTVPKPSSLANGLTLKYDAWNRLAQVTDGETIVAKYEYDGDNRRITKHIDSQSPGSPNGIDRYEHLFYVGIQLVETRNTTTLASSPESLVPHYQWVWSPRYIDASILRDENTDSDSLCDDSRLYYTTDANMNVTSLVDTSGDALERYVYDPYGCVTVYNATWSNTRSTTAYDNCILFTGRHSDFETGLYYYRARYYSAELGRFLSRDPIGYKGGINSYEYCGDAPLRRTDPSGTQTVVSDIPPDAGPCDAIGWKLCNSICGHLPAPANFEGPPKVKCGQTDTLKFNPYNGFYIWSTYYCKCQWKQKCTCTKAERATLQAAVDVACSKGRRCQSGMSRDEALANAAAFDACAAARDAVNKKCFNGGDDGHQRAANNARAAAQNCREIAAFQPPPNVG